MTSLGMSLAGGCDRQYLSQDREGNLVARKVLCQNPPFIPVLPPTAPHPPPAGEVRLRLLRLAGDRNDHVGEGSGLDSAIDQEPVLA